MGSVIAIGTAVIDTVLTTDKSFDMKVCNKILRSCADGGAIRNVAHNLSLLGDEVLFWAKFGNDTAALDMITRLENARVQVHAKVIDLPTPHFYQLIDAGSSMMISSTTDDFYFDKDDLLPTFLLHDEKYGITDQDDYGFLKKLTDRSPSIRWIAMGFLPHPDLQKYFFAVFVNRNEALRYNETLDAFFMKSAELPLTVVTLDKDGLVYDYEGKSKSMPAPTLDKGNALGMGDALVAGFIHRYLKGLPIESCLSFGIECAQRTSEVNTAINPDLVGQDLP